jgi:hypothetical protein
MWSRKAIDHTIYLSHNVFRTRWVTLFYSRLQIVTALVCGKPHGAGSTDVQTAIYSSVRIERMNTVSERLLDTFDNLPQSVQWQVASEILRRTLAFDFPPLSDDELVMTAEMVFLDLDVRESEDEQTPTR